MRASLDKMISPRIDHPCRFFIVHTLVGFIVIETAAREEKIDICSFSFFSLGDN